MTLTEYDLCTKKPWRRKHMKDNKVKAILSSQADLSCTQVCNEKGECRGVFKFFDLIKIL